MPDIADTVYAPKPWGSNEERLVGEALASAALPAGPIGDVRPPIPRIVLFPPRFGYETEEPTIRDIMDVDHRYPGARVDYSGSNSGYQGTSYPSLNVW